MRVLLADDEKEMVRALTRILEVSGYQADVASNGLDALRLLRTSEYDAVILDIMMPFMDGLEVLRTIRAENNKVPVLLLSAKTEVSDRIRGLDAGADDYLVKPFASGELLARIRVMTRRADSVQQADPMLLTWKDLSLSRADGKLRCGANQVRLTEKEFRMMELFMEHPEFLVSTDTLVEKVWGYECNSDNNVVWTTLSRLRRNLEKIGSGVKIRSNRGLGYYLEAEEIR